MKGGLTNTPSRTASLRAARAAAITATYRGQRRTFLYEPGRASGAVKGLYSSKEYLIYVDEKPLSDLDRYIVGFSGRSPIGLDFDRTVSGGARITFDDGKRTVGQVHVWPVRGVTTAELDYLAAPLIRTKGQF